MSAVTSLPAPLRRLLPASLDAKQGPWRSQAQSAVIILQCFPGSNGVPGSKDRAQGLRGRQGPGGAGEAQRLMTRLGDSSVAATAEGAGVSDPEAKEETAHSSQTGAGYLGPWIFTVTQGSWEITSGITSTLATCFFIAHV